MAPHCEVCGIHAAVFCQVFASLPGHSLQNTLKRFHAYGLDSSYINLHYVVFRIHKY